MATVYPVGVVSRHLLLVLLGADVHHGCCLEGKGGVGRLLGSFSWPAIVPPNFVTPCPTFFVHTILNCRGLENVGRGVTGT